MKVLKDALKTLIVNEKFTGKTKQEIEDGIKAMLKAKMIDVDNFSNAMEIIYGDE